MIFAAIDPFFQPTGQPLQNKFYRFLNQGPMF